MMTYLDRLAWGLALLAIVAWALVPKMAVAYPVMMPKPPAVDSLNLPPVPSNDVAKADRETSAGRPDVPTLPILQVQRTGPT